MWTLNAEAKLEFSTCDVDGEYHQLFPSRFPVVPLYERFGALNVQRAAEALEAKTNPRIIEMARLDLPPRPASNANRSQNWNLAPFAYPIPEGTTFLNPAYRLLELIEGIRPAMAVAMMKRETFLGDSEEPPINVEMRAVKRRIRGHFVDLRGHMLDNDQKIRWKLGASIYEQGAQGIIFNRPDLPGINAVAIFDSDTMDRAIQLDHYRFVWDGKMIRTIGNFRTEEQTKREDLLAELIGRAAA